MSDCDIIGKRFNRITVLNLIGKNNDGRNLYLCMCDCGNVVKVSYKSLKSGNTKSCGCYSNDSKTKYKPSGYIKKVKYSNHNDWGSKEHKTWLSIKQRCYNEKNCGYKNYGFRGVKVCDRWLASYKNFLKDMGRAPTKKHSINRVDNNGDYDPKNCKWDTVIEQCNNRRSNVVLEYNGESHTVMQWSKIVNINYDCLIKRKRMGWGVEKIITTPVNTNFQRLKKTK